MDFLKSVGVHLVVYKRNSAIWPLSVFFLIFLCIYFFPYEKAQFGRKKRFFSATNHCAMNIVLRICAFDVTAREESPKMLFFWATYQCGMIIVLWICAVDVAAGEDSPKLQFVPISSRKFYHFLSFLLLFSGKI